MPGGAAIRVGGRYEDEAMKPLETLSLAVLAAAALSACSSGPRTPDEFRVVRKAPLVVPPEFNLRPPAPGESRPQELSPDAQARVSVFGSDIGRDASDGEKMLVTKAGGDAVDRTVRSAIDFETTQILRKNRSLADSILTFGRSSSDPTVDAAAEAERLAAQKSAAEEVTGPGQVILPRKNASKLPGL
jgi:hypothetical protein